MKEKDIQQILDNLGNRVGKLSEENRLYKLKNDTSKILFGKLGELINQEDWLNLYESCENNFLKDLMREWGTHFFPNKYKF